MSKSVFAAVGLTVLTAVAAQAQGLSTPVCTSTGTASQNVAQDACQQAYDIFQFMAPQLGLALAGGNATLGQGSSLGGLGHFSVGIRGNVFNGVIPQIDQFTQRTSGATPALVLPSKKQVLALPTADAAIGLFGGLPFGLTNIGGVDLLVSASYVPTIGDGNKDFSLKPKQNLQLGYGVRVGLLSESIVVPGVSLTYLKRDLPSTTIAGSASYTSGLGATTASLTISDATVKTSAFRIVASKSLIFFGFAAGVGQDTYKQSANISANVTSTLGGMTTTTVPNAYPDIKRTNAFFDASLNLPLFKLVGEVGQVSGGTVNTYNSIGSSRADRSLTYGSVGLRLSL
ncbi:MAG: hypothetical protein ABJA80_11985 [bacterium]